MFCNKCGNDVNQNQQYCNKCGNILIYNVQNERKNNNNKYRPFNYNINNNSYNKKKIVLPISIIIIVVAMIYLYIFVLKEAISGGYDFGGENEPETTMTTTAGTTQVSPGTTATTKGKYKTTIVTDNTYSGISIKSMEDANKLISQDSLNQKQSDYPKEIIEIENNIINKYSVTAVNLKEMDQGFAKELENVLENIYINYPSARGYLTNLTLTNLSMSEANAVALFMPIFMFGTSNTNTTRPWVIKTQIQLNAKYFLNPERIEASTKASSESGHFPPNSTRYSPLVHEFGHYLSFIALLNYYSTNSIIVVGDNQLQNYYNIFRDFGNGTFSKKMLDEAYQNYLNDNGTIGFDEWRGQISNYALAKDDKGDYIYDETIAEAFHDVYLNSENADSTSKYVVKVLKKYIER